MSFGSFIKGVPVIGQIGDNSDQDMQDSLNQSRRDYFDIGSPKFKNYSPEDYQDTGDYAPQLAQATQVSENPLTRSAQMSALSKMAGLADTGLSDQDQAGYEKARSIGDQMEHSGNAAAMQNAQARGVGGSGLEFMMREQANQDGAQRAQEAGLGQAADSSRQRALYQQAYGNQLSGMRDQDYRAQSNNASILNQFNMANTQSQNQGQLYNLNNRQNIANMNTADRNSAQQYNNGLAQQSYQDALSRTAGLASANTNIAKGYAAQNAANTQSRNNNTQLLASMFMA